MKFSLAASFASLAAVVLARPEFTNSAYDVKAGQAFTLSWDKAVGTVTITLKSGPDSNSLTTYSTLATTTGASGSQSVTIPTSVPSGKYAFAISDQSGDPENYSTLFDIVGTGSSTTGSVSTTRSSSASASSSSSASTSGSSSSSASTTATSHSSTASQTTLATSSSSASKAATGSNTAAATTSTSIPNNTGAGGKLQSSLAMVFLGVAAYIFLN